MDHWTPDQYIFAAAIVIVTATAVFTDLRHAKIPNALTLPFFALGWVFQGYQQFWGGQPDALWNGLTGFGLGFGTYFVLWIVSGGGGGDTKLMGALSVWLGFYLTLWVIVLSTILVATDLMFVTAVRFLRFGFRGVRDHSASERKSRERGRAGSDGTGGRVDNRRRLRFAVPLAMAAWLVLLADATIHLQGGQLGP